MNYKLTISYDGTRYKGWQRLGNDDSTVQGKIESVLSRMTEKTVEIIGASRTDAGVHAIGQVANVHLSGDFMPSDMQEYLNRFLPDDIAVLRVELAPDDFHARYMVKSKTYCYTIWNMPQPHPFARKYSMHIQTPMDISLMREAAANFLGTHDFTTFTNAKSKKKSMVREIYNIEVQDKDGFVYIRVCGNGFLHHMVRRMVGTLIEVGLCQKQIKIVADMLQNQDRSAVQCVAEAKGLCLEKIEY